MIISETHVVQQTSASEYVATVLQGQEFDTFPGYPISPGPSAKHVSFAYDDAYHDIVTLGGDGGGSAVTEMWACDIAQPQASMWSHLLNQAEAGQVGWDRSIVGNQEYPTGLSIISGGTGYTGEKRYEGIVGAEPPKLRYVDESDPLNEGSLATVLVDVHGGAVTGLGFGDSCNNGKNYKVGDRLTVDNSYIGGTGSGFECEVMSVTSAGAESALAYPVGRCWPALCKDTNRNLFWMQAGDPRGGNDSPNLVQGGLWAFRRSDKTWHKQGPGLGDSVVGRAHVLYNAYQRVMYHDKEGDALYVLALPYVFKYSLTGIVINVEEDRWEIVCALPNDTYLNGDLQQRHAHDTLRRRIVFYAADPNTPEIYGNIYAFDIASGTVLPPLNNYKFPFLRERNWWYHKDADRIISIGGGIPDAGIGDYNYNGRTCQTAYIIHPETGAVSELVYEGPPYIKPDDDYAKECDGVYDEHNKCLVVFVLQVEYMLDGVNAYHAPGRAVIWKLQRPEDAA